VFAEVVTKKQSFASYRRPLFGCKRLYSDRLLLLLVIPSYFILKLFLVPSSSCIQRKNKLEIKILAKLFAIQIVFSPKPVSRSKALIMKVFLFPVFLLFHHTFPSSSLFLFTMWPLFFFFPFWPSLCVVSSSSLNIKIRINVRHSAVTLDAKCKNISFSIRSTDGSSNLSTLDVFRGV
jgi:hypothetical protein